MVPYSHGWALMLIAAELRLSSLRSVRGGGRGGLGGQFIFYPALSILVFVLMPNQGTPVPIRFQYTFNSIEKGFRTQLNFV